MPSRESNRRNLEYARNTGRVKFWRSPAESQVIKALILRAHLSTPRPSQRAIARQFRVSQPYVAKLIKRAQRVGIEEALGPEAYRHFTAYRDTELRERNQSLVAEWQRSLGRTTAPNPQRAESHSPGQAKPAQQEGPTQYVELVRSTTGEVIELHGSRPCQPPTAQPQQKPAVGIPLSAIYEPSRRQVDDLLREWAGIRPGGKNRWF